MHLGMLEWKHDENVTGGSQSDRYSKKNMTDCLELINLSSIIIVYMELLVMIMMAM